jgi:hypothetical protein
MQFNKEAEAIFLFAQWSGLVHDIVRGFALKYGLDESLTEPPEVAWEWVLEGVRHGAPDLDHDDRFQLAAHCFRSIRDRMRRNHGGQDGVH